MKRTRIGQLGKFALPCIFGCMAAQGNAEIFYGGDMTGLPGEAVQLSIHARAGTLLEAIDIVPQIDDVAGVLNFVAFNQTPALTDGGIGLCTGQACGFFYVPEKTFATDTMLAALHFQINPGAATGLVPFDPGVTFGEDIQPLVNFEVLAVPEASTWALFVFGLALTAVAVRRRANR